MVPIPAASAIAYALETANARVVGPCNDRDHAEMGVLHSELAVLNIDIQGRTSSGLADRLSSLEIPFLFFAGGSSSLLL